MRFKTRRKMDLHIYYKFEFDLNDKVDGFNISFDPDKNDFGKLIEFVQKYPDKEINIHYSDGIDTKTAAAIAKVGSNVRFRLGGQDIQKADRLRENGCKFFLDKDCGVSSYWELRHLVEVVGVDSVYIVDDLCYNLVEVSKYCHDHGVRLRVVLNRCPTKIVHDDKRLMFYRPQDMGYIENYYDIAEFECGEGVSGFNAGLCEVLYKRFFVKRDWYGNVQELNPSLPFEVYNRQLPLPYVRRRSTCGLRCLHDNSSCNYCGEVYKLMSGMVGKGLQFDMRPDREHDAD